MNDIKVTKQMKRHAVIVAIKAQHDDTEIARFLKVARSFVAKVRKHLEAADRDPALAAKRKTHAKCPNAIKTHKFVQKVQEKIQENPLQMTLRTPSECTIRRAVHEDIRHKSYVMPSGQFI